MSFSWCFLMFSRVIAFNGHCIDLHIKWRRRRRRRRCFANTICWTFQNKYKRRERVCKTVVSSINADGKRSKTHESKFHFQRKTSCNLSMFHTPYSVLSTKMFLSFLFQCSKTQMQHKETKGKQHYVCDGMQFHVSKSNENKKKRKKKRKSQTHRWFNLVHVCTSQLIAKAFHNLTSNVLQFAFKLSVL